MSVNFTKGGGDMRIADVHAHIFPDKLAEKAAVSIGDFYEVESENVAYTNRLLQLEKEAGIGTVLVCNSAVNAHQAPGINAFMHTVLEENPGVMAMGSLFPGMEDWQGELERICQLGLVGIKIHSDFQHVDIDEPAAVEMYRAIAKKGLPVLFHMGDWRYDHSSPKRLVSLKRQVPDLIAIAAHFGGYRRWHEAIECPKMEGIWFDTSSTLSYIDMDMARRMLDRFGTESFLFGTDFPMWTPKTELNKFLDAPLGLSQKEKEAILYDNFARLFKLEETV
jgi:predicted TIM-barrel fold metal-dependent hydrolase